MSVVNMSSTPVQGDASAITSISSSSTVAAKRTRKRARGCEPLNYLQAAAQTYHDLGLPITLCKGKAPFQPDWPNRTWSRSAIDGVYKVQGAANVGLIVGPRSGMVDFECDGPDSEQTLSELFDHDIPETPTWQSRRGAHRLFRWHPALEQLGKSKLKLGGDGAQLEILIGPGLQTLLPPSWADGVQRTWLSGEQSFPHAVAPIPDTVLVKLGCDLAGSPVTTADSCVLAGSAVSTEPAVLDTDSIPTSVISVVSVISVSNLDDATSQRIMAAVQRCLVTAPGMTNDKFLSLVIALKGLPELAETMADELEPYIRYWYDESVPHMQDKDWKSIWDRWLYTWLWAKPGYDVIRMAFEAAKREALPQCALMYPVQQMRLLVGLCRVLQRQYADERGHWFLSCRSAAEVLGVGYKYVAQFLNMLVADGVLEILEHHTTVKARRYRYLKD